MLQDADLPDKLTPQEHLTLFASYYPKPLSVSECMEMCAIDTFAHKSYGKLSGGQKRRVQFAVSLIGAPDLIFLDEPTTGLDPDARRVMWDLIRTLSNEGKTIVLTTHYLEEADTLADRIVVINEGMVIADAPTPEIRNAVGGAIIRCITALNDSVLNTLPAVRSVRKAGRFTEILTSDQTATLRGLLERDPNVTELTVSKPSLEEAFLDLTHNRSTAHEELATGGQS